MESLRKEMKKMDDVKGLERHAYAPEMNKLHFVNGDIINVPQMKTIKDALKYIAR